jgi:uncharacterized protein YlxW (UPF0749 family)
MQVRRGGTTLAAWQRGVAALLLFAGFLLVLQLRAEQALQAELALPSYRLADLAVLIRRQQEADRALTDEVRALEAKQQQIQRAVAAGRGIVEALRRERDAYHLELGQTPVEGPGVTVVVSADPNHLSVPQAQDVRGIVNELWAAGAEAVSVNGIRMLATDGIAAVPVGVRIGDRITRDPYVFAAIGDPTVLEGALTVPGGPVDGLRGVGLAVRLRRVDVLRLPAASLRHDFRIARPMGKP